MLLEPEAIVACESVSLRLPLSVHCVQRARNARMRRPETGRKAGRPSRASSQYIIWQPSMIHSPWAEIYARSEGTFWSLSGHNATAYQRDSQQQHQGELYLTRKVRAACT